MSIYKSPKTSTLVIIAVLILVSGIFLLAYIPRTITLYQITTGYKSITIPTSLKFIRKNSLKGGIDASPGAYYYYSAADSSRQTFSQLTIALEAANFIPYGQQITSNSSFVIDAINYKSHLELTAQNGITVGSPAKEVRINIRHL
jgi:hypothetical protein